MGQTLEIEEGSRIEGEARAGVDSKWGGKPTLGVSAGSHCPEAGSQAYHARPPHQGTTPHRLSDRWMDKQNVLGHYSASKRKEILTPANSRDGP